MARAVDLTGQVFGRLTVLGSAPKQARNPNRRWLVQCECSTKKSVFGMDLIAGRTVSCGCRRDELSAQRAREMTKHGQASNWNGKKPSREYNAWASMWSRCTNKKSRGFQHYGGKGVKVASRWKLFENFLADMGSCPAGFELERKNPAGDYSSRNCIWIPSALQARNKRSTLWLSYQGKQLQVVAWAEHPEFGSEFEVTVNVVVKKSAPRDRKKCHNPWPAHTCPKVTKAAR